VRSWSATSHRGDTRVKFACLVLWSLTLLFGACGGGGPEVVAPPVEDHGGQTPVTEPSALATSLRSTLVGRWESVRRSRGGIGEVLDLGEDGTHVRGPAVLVDLSYELNGPQLTLAAPGEAALPARDVTVTAATMQISDADEREPLRHRVGSPASGPPSIVGVWKYEHYAGGTAFERYEAGGRLEFRLSMPATAHGRWTAEAGVLQLRSDESEVSFDADIDGDLLTIAWSRESGERAEAAFRRTERWFDFPMSAADSDEILETLGEGK
jgi:hypothetical protein